MHTLARLERLGFALTDEQRQIAASVHDFAKRRIAPGAGERDRSGRFPVEVMNEAMELGLHAMKVPVGLGGAGADNVSYALVMEAVAEACASVAVILASSNLTAKILADHTTAAQKARAVRPYAEGKLGPASFALSEPGCGTDAAALRTTARPERGGWVLDGSKMWITSATHAG
jgi:hypothetical protein